MNDTPKSILYLEDDEDTRRPLTWILEREGYTVYPFSTAWESLESIREGLRYDLALLDLTMPDRNMPNEDVDDVIRESKNRNPSVHIITFSGWPDTTGEYKRKGVHAHYNKGEGRDKTSKLLELIAQHLKR
ncbi:MAG TPA: response regulator [Candidatus Nanoarchaeia archaeon]|nr:response regulator [Candidatus Nanoarchaeia archaeon]